MSTRAKFCLFGSVGVASLMIWYVHMKQEWEREKLHSGVIKDQERQRLKKALEISMQSRFTVKFPFRELGSSKDIAMHRLHEIERRFTEKPSLSTVYHKFMKNYLKLDQFERIIWRDSPFTPIQDFRLTRIAYGSTPVAYLADKCLQQLAIQEQPLGSKAALKELCR
ncbi:uncharacterized protein CDAR_596201 [Caerostris darwini]|uniref:Uncharacterized protein n=1 Tax=Caerostris darwini TaxID=1538125 RepID=A0AAV4UY35_9ARAC|nr:uncharacterized protein CDAR_596201 [Caerostris darwini]